MEIIRPEPILLPSDFIENRVKYYQDTKPISAFRLMENVFPNSLSPEAALRRQRAIEQVRESGAEVCVLTATNNRLVYLEKAYDSLFSQKGGVSWIWLVVDNSSDDGTREYFESLGDRRVVCVQYTEKTGCAYPARNFGLDTISLAYGNSGKSSWITVIDSDDGLDNEFSLMELVKLKRYGEQETLSHVLVHGYASCEYRDDDGEITYGSHPHNISSDFPRINTLSEVFDKGLNILSGMFPAALLSFLRYPPEYSFEDGAFNHKLMLYAQKLNRGWECTGYPITVKRFHNETMARKSDLLGDQTKSAVIGEHIVAGMRTDIVRNLKYLTDYFTRESL